MSTTDFGGKVVLITGASRGLGLSIAEAFWSHGADLYLVSRSEDSLALVADRLSKCGRSGQRVGFLKADLSEAGAVERIVQDLHRFGGRLDVVVNNAAIVGPIGPLTDNDWAAWQNTLQVNFIAPAAICKAAASSMRKQGGVILNISGGGATGPRPFFSAYASAKAALVRFSETLAAEVKPHGIRVNCIAPGAMNTQMTSAVLEAGPQLSGEAEYQKALDQGRGATAPEIPAALAVYLASPECSQITGRLISAAWDPWQDLHRHGTELESSDVYTLRRIVPEDRGLRWGR
jgi:NAD(P)-dependent dehydrogenase (short-subunit alcohol dehydrogenase family)